MTAERYAAVFSGPFDGKRRGEYTHPSMGCGSGGSTMTPRRGWTPYERVGREIPFRALPELCRRPLLEAHRDSRGLQEERTATVYGLPLSKEPFEP